MGLQSSFSGGGEGHGAAEAELPAHGFLPAGGLPEAGGTMNRKPLGRPAGKTGQSLTNHSPLPGLCREEHCAPERSTALPRKHLPLVKV